jgi:C1q domain
MSISAAEFLKWLLVFNVGQGGGGGGGGGLYLVSGATTQSYVMTYNNGSGGVGATLTSVPTGVIAFDSTGVIPGQYYLVKDQTDESQNGIYVCNNQGSIVPPVHALFTRATYYDQPSQIKLGDLVSVTGGNTLAGSTWAQTQVVTAVGPGNNIIFEETGVNAVTLTGDVTGTGVSTVPTTLATVNSTPGTFGSATQTPVVTVNAKGLVTAITNASIQITESQVTNLTTDLASKLNLSGGTMTGLLTLSGDPTTNLQAVTKQYNDAGNIIASWDGSTMTGVNITAGTGISLSSSGVINATGSGAPVLCAFEATLGGALLNATGDGTLVNITCNNAPVNIGSAYSTSTGLFTAPLNGIYLFIGDIFLGNLSNSHTQYLMYWVAAGTTYMIAQGNPANERSSASNQLTRRGSLLIQLSAGDTVQIQCEVDGSSKTATIGAGTQPTSFAGFLVGTLGSPGVLSLQGLDGALSLTSPNSTIAISTPSGSTIGLKATLPVTNVAPVIAVLSGVTGSVTGVSSLADATTPDVNGMVTVVAKFTLTTDGSGGLVKLAITPPYAATFSSVTQAMPVSVVATPTALLGAPGTLGDGKLNQLFADTLNQWIEADIEVSQINTAYTFWLTYKYQVA